MTLDTAVIGKGLVGCAAAKYLCLDGQRVVLIGPDEPVDPASSPVFASHYDSGRVQRQIGHNEAMTRLNLEAVQHYPWLEEESGVSFHGTSGCLYVNPRGADAYLERAPAIARKHDIEARFYESGAELARAFPDFTFPEMSAGMFETSPSGHIDPRRLILAQLAVVERRGGTVIRECVREVRDGPEAMTITTAAGTRVRARQVLVAAGAFTNLTHLVTRAPALTLKSETVILARVSASESARLKTLPSLLYEVDMPEVEGIYATPPLQYPDGRHYLKMGCNLPADIYFGSDLAAVQEWFRSGDSDVHVATMLAALRAIMPGLAVEDCHSKRCILTRTSRHGNPYVGRVHDRMAVAVGNGWSAMASDAIGRVATHLMRHGALPDGYPAGAFEPVWLP